MKYTCHSGGALGADIHWEVSGRPYGIKTISYSFTGHNTATANRLVLTDDQLKEGFSHVLIANETLKRYTTDISNKYVKSLLSRNWFQVKNSEAVFAISSFQNKTKTKVSGGTGWAVQMAIDNNKPVYVFDQLECHWYIYDFTLKRFIKFYEIPVLTPHFAGIGSRDLTLCGRMEIEKVLENSKK